MPAKTLAVAEVTRIEGDSFEKMLITGPWSEILKLQMVLMKRGELELSFDTQISFLAAWNTGIQTKIHRQSHFAQARCSDFPQRQRLKTKG